MHGSIGSALEEKLECKQRCGHEDHLKIVGMLSKLNVSTIFYGNNLLSIEELSIQLFYTAFIGEVHFSS